MRSGGSIGANYIEANESLGKKDFLMKIRICRKEAKETRYWLKLLDEKILSEEAMEYMRIFGSILEKFKSLVSWGQRREAIINLKEAFLAPPSLTTPFKGVPPWIMSLFRSGPLDPYIKYFFLYHNIPKISTIVF